MRKDPVRRDSVVSIVRHIDSLKQKVAEGKETRDTLTNAMADLIPACGFNYGLLIPDVFHSYPDDKPLDFAARPFMFAMTSLAPNTVLTLRAGRQVGKCVDGGSTVETNQGQKSVRDLFAMGTLSD